jgi:hypothetical protein
LNGNPVAGDTTQYIVTNVLGSYQVKVTDSAGCSDISALHVTTDVQDISDFSVTLYPNPNNGIFTVRFSDNVNRQIKIEDALGRAILGYEFVAGEKLIMLPALSDGVYFLNIVENGRLKVIRFVVGR